MTVLAIHQPNFLPWLGYFDKMWQSDVFVIMDHAQVPIGRSYASRTMIKAPEGKRWLTLPIPRSNVGVMSYSYHPLLPCDQWLSEVWNVCKNAYHQAPYWNFRDFENTLNECAVRCSYLGDLNLRLILWAIEALGIDTTIILQSTLDIRAGKHILPIRLCEATGCDVYLSGTGAAVYNQPELFEEAGIELRYQKFECPPYPQQWGEFAPNLSIIDLLFNCGPESWLRLWPLS